MGEHKANGREERDKACRMTKGFTEVYGIDYKETFCIRVKLDIVRVLLWLTSNLDLSLYQLNVIKAHFNSDLMGYTNIVIHPKTELDSLSISIPLVKHVQAGNIHLIGNSLWRLLIAATQS